MVNNQFGMVGLLTFIRAAESDPNLVTLAMGQDLTGLGLNLNSQENLYPTFGGPFSDQPCRYVYTVLFFYSSLCNDVQSKSSQQFTGLKTSTFTYHPNTWLICQ